MASNTQAQSYDSVVFAAMQTLSQEIVDRDARKAAEEHAVWLRQEAKIRAVEDQINLADAKCAKLEQSVEEAMKGNAEALQTLEIKEAHITTIEAENSKLRQLLENKNRQYQQLQARAEYWETESRQGKRNVKAADQPADSSDRRLAAWIERGRALKQEKENLRLEVQGYIEKCDDLEEQLNTSKQALADREAEMALSDSRLAAVEEELTTTKQALTGARQMTARTAKAKALGDNALATEEYESKKLRQICGVQNDQITVDKTRPAATEANLPVLLTNLEKAVSNMKLINEREE